MKCIPRRALLLVVFLAGTASVRAETELAFIHMEQVFQNFYRTAQKNAAFQKQKDEFNDYAKELQVDLDAVKTLRDQLRDKAMNIGLSDEVRQQSRKQAEENDRLHEEKQQELRSFVTSKDRELKAKFLDLRREILEEISDFITAYAEKQGLTAVLDVSGMTNNMISAVVYFRSDKDITKLVLTALNKGHEDDVAAGGGEQDTADDDADPSTSTPDE